MILIGMAWLYAGCQASIDSQRALYQWVHNPANGMVKSKEVGLYRLTMKYLPPELQASRGLARQSAQQVAGLLKSGRDNLTFVLNLSLVSPSGGQDIMYQEVSSYAAYKKRALDMNFNMAKYIAIKADGKEISPSIAHLENTYSLTQGRNIVLVFDRKQVPQSAQKLDITFTDQLFGTGIHHFVFHQKDLDNLPQVTYLGK
ncbi:hypothetical protein M23134_03329 [Microscilla marina ATCC 23134]|uniref:Uncharacterized protein n=2 Tax=Microscilla marina TaxID=1027 RepID=A2A013_MICM2|nr:hypothetical protein M23134_03329 [Microscilla marina ATCC 23134]